MASIECCRMISERGIFIWEREGYGPSFGKLLRYFALEIQALHRCGIPFQSQDRRVLTLLSVTNGHSNTALTKISK